MFSKKTFFASLISVSLGIGMLTACAPKVGEAPPDPDQQTMGGTKCLSNLKPVVVKFVEAEATASEVAEFWDCATTSMKMFKRYVYGRTDDRFTSKELVEFVETNFLTEDGPKISDELRLQFMKFKQLLIGGSDQDLTRAELDQIVVMFEDLKAISVRVNPYMKVITQKWMPSTSRASQADAQYLEKASEEIQVAASDLAAMIVKSKKSYALDDFVTFLKEYGAFYGAKWTVPQTIQANMPIVKKIKTAIAGGDQGVIATSEWKSFVLIGTRGYIQYLRYHYFIQASTNTAAGVRISYLARTFEDMLGAFQELLQVKPTDPACGTYKDKSGQSRGVSCISKNELTDILSSFSKAWPEFKVSPKLIGEMMKLKKMYFAGSDQNITSLDFERGKNKVPGLRAVIEKFLPYYSVYSLEWDRANYDDTQATQIFAEANVNLISSAKDLGSLVEDNYDIESLVELLKEIDRLYPSEDSSKSLIAQFGRYVPLMRDVKNVIFSEKDSAMKKAQWSPFLATGARFYSTFLYYHYFMAQESFGTARFLEVFKHLSDQVIDITKDVIAAKKSQSFSASEVELLARRLSELDILPKELSSSSIDQLVKLLLNRVLWPAESRIRGNAPNALTVNSLQYAKNELQIWYETERYGMSISSDAMRPSEFQSTLSQTLKSSKISDALRIGVGELALLVSGPVPQTVDSDQQLVISNLTRHLYGRLSLSQMNAKRAITRALIRASITSKSRLESYQGVNLDEVNAVYKSVHPILVQMKLTEKENVTFAENRFRDANLFTAHGNGDNVVSFQEAGDLVGMMMSAIRINNQIKKDIVGRCLSRHAKVTLQTTVSEKCLRDVYNDRIDNYFKSTPEFVRFFKASSREDFAIYFGNLMKAGGHFPNEQGTVRLADADQFPHAIQYVEMMIQRFDDDQNGIMNIDEAIKSFPSFKGILMEMTKDQSVIKEKDLLAVFTYIMHYGKPPGGVKDYLFKFLPWKRNPDKWTVDVDRQKLSGILGFIADSVKASLEKKSLLSAADQEEIRRSSEYRLDQ